MPEPENGHRAREHAAVRRQHDVLMPRCEAEGRASKHAKAGRCLGGVRPSRLAPLAPQDEGLGSGLDENADSLCA